jgi:hypothetical protein
VPTECGAARAKVSRWASTSSTYRRPVTEGGDRRDARAEAEARARALRGDCSVQVLEPSPPAVDDPPWFADADPSGERIVGPYSDGEWSWAALAAEDPTLVAWCEERWLGPYRRLEALPAEFAQTRLALHELAEKVISPARQRANTKIGLRWTLGGFGTPFFGADAQVRVEHGELVLQKEERVRRAAIGTLASARELLGDLAGPDGDGASGAALAVDANAASALGEYYGFATSVLEELRHGAQAPLEPSRVQLWPEHFDIAIELGGEAAGKRAGYGASPGDDAHAAPYLYVVPWGETPSGDRWQAEAFAGAQLDYGVLLAARDQRAVALEFFRGCLAELAGR